jgi:hypothetical protein
MRWGLMNLGMGPFTRPEWMAEAARTAEKRGFNSLFVGEHFASFDNYQAYDPYLYRPEGELPMTNHSSLAQSSRGRETDCLDRPSVRRPGGIRSRVRMGAGGISSRRGPLGAPVEPDGRLRSRDALPVVDAAAHLPWRILQFRPGLFLPQADSE